ncbi:PREDICTED: P-selectin-like [Nanorana parkeri]|uniref:P-selectin-like n=1 Tax=Nanorana parkeri TaxID=125878 RepID=UPI0008547A59|nr:PREDICTED: P-selectin-like [Nanorana parkeri]
MTISQYSKVIFLNPEDKLYKLWTSNLDWAESLPNNEGFSGESSVPPYEDGPIRTDDLFGPASPYLTSILEGGCGFLSRLRQVGVGSVMPEWLLPSHRLDEPGREGPCQNDRKPPAVSCVDLQEPANGKITCTDKYGKSQYKTYCNFSCNEGYELNGTKSVFCQNTGEWSEPTPTCLAVSCVDLQEPANGKITCTDKYGKSQYKTYCNFSCNEGYELNGTKSVFCQNTGEWSEPTPTCLAVSCVDLQEPANGKITCTDKYGKSQYKTYCNFSCNEGYELNGTKSVFCQNTGEWSEPTPTCLAVSCADLQIIANGKINCTIKYGKSQYKSFCNFSCNEGYELNGTTSVFCQNTGEWSEATPTCLAWNVSFGKQKQVAIKKNVPIS